MIKTRYYHLYSFVEDMAISKQPFYVWFRVQYPKKFQELRDLADKGAWEPEFQLGDEIYKQVLDWAIDLRQVAKKYRDSKYQGGLYSLIIRVEKLAHESQKAEPMTFHIRIHNEPQKRDSNDPGNNYILKTSAVYVPTIT